MDIDVIAQVIFDALKKRGYFKEFDEETQDEIVVEIGNIIEQCG